MFQAILDRIKEWLNGKELSEADLTAKLEEMAEGTGLNWKVSIVDFLKLLEMDSSRKSRDALASELGVSDGTENWSAERNEALRVALFKALSENGGNIPSDLLD